MVATTGANRPPWRRTKRLALIVAIVPAAFQYLLGLYTQLILPPPPPGLASPGAAVMLGSIVTGGAVCTCRRIVGVLDRHRDYGRSAEKAR